MNRKTDTTHQRIVDRGLEMVSKHGLAGVSLGDLAERAELSKSGLFAHFRSKEDLQLELLRAAEDALRCEVIVPAMTAAAGLPRLRTIMARMLGWATRAGLPGGCPLYSAAFELDDAEEGPVRDFLAVSHRDWCALLTSAVREAVELGHLRDDLDPAQFAWQINGIYLAHHVSQRLTRDPEADARAHAAFEALITSSLPEQFAAPNGAQRTIETAGADDL
jgi:AcrR family transcriptional regulator